ncbi:MAG: phosphatase PAP2 family protein [Verrucomicrobiales bacterium]|nr:phosphatase PAP2 family protein [Verrucomicrobiales bacterium]
MDCTVLSNGVGSVSFAPSSGRSVGLRTLLVAALTISVCSPSHGGDAIEASGDILQFVLPTVALGATIIHRDDRDGRRWDRKGTLQLGEGLATAMGVTFALKYALDTDRPNGGHHSMPSGHTSISFASAEFLRKRYGWEWGIPAYAVASWVGYSRVESDNHYPADVVVGAGIGILSSYIFTRKHKGWNVDVTGDTQSVGLRLSTAW